MAINQSFKTLATANQFHFACPVFGAETAISTCFRLRDMVWKGQKPAQRQGCQVCMAAGRCPINDIIKDMFARGEDPYFSAEKKVGHLLPSHLAKVSNVRVLDMHMRMYGPSEKETALILEANEKASVAGAKKTAELERGAGKRARQKPEAIQLDAIEARATAKAIDDDVAAAIAGDMTAAINREVAKAPIREVAPAPAPEVPAKPQRKPVTTAAPAPVSVTGSKPMSLLERARLAKEVRP